MALFGDSERISVVAELQAQEGHEDEVREALNSLVGPSRKETGCIKYDLFEDKHSVGAFFTYEEWASEAALRKHLELNKTTLEKTKPMLRTPMSLKVLKQLA